MIDKYLDGKLPTLDQIDYQPTKPGMLDKIEATLHIDKEHQKKVALAPTPELIDVLWGYYLATGDYKDVYKRQPLCRLGDVTFDLDRPGTLANFCGLVSHLHS